VENGYHTVRIRRRPWWAWLLAALWLLLLVAGVQTAVASGWESEYRAAAVSWVLVAALLLVGGVAWWQAGRAV